MTEFTLSRIFLNHAEFAGPNDSFIELGYDPVEKNWEGELNLHGWIFGVDQPKVDLLVSQISEKDLCVIYANPLPQSLDHLLDTINVDGAPTEDGLWPVVSEDDGLLALFPKEVDAHRYRLDYINRMMNP